MSTHRSHRSHRPSLPRPRPRPAHLALVGGLLAVAGTAGVALAAGPASAPSSGSRPVSVLPARTLRTLIGTALTITRGEPPTTPTPPTPPPTPPVAAQPYWAGPPATGFVSAGSFWRTPVSTAPVAANSAALVSYLAGHVSDRYGGVAAFNAHQFPVSFVTAAAGTPTTNVAFQDCQHKGYVPAGLTGPGGQFTAVPIPAGAIPSYGTDDGLSVWSPSTDQLWEFWELQHTATGWSACWGGRIDHVSQSSGIFSGGFGESATGLALSAGMVTVDEARTGVIDHAIALDIPDAALWSTYSWPAQRSDGSSSAANAVPEGTRFRLDPSIDVAKLPGLTPIARAVARAAQTYGFVVTDTAGAVAVLAQSGAMQQAATGVDPWTAPEAGTPDYAILRNFPWSALQALPKDYGKP